MNILKVFFGRKQQMLSDLKLAKQIEISGDWTKSFWKELPVRVYSEPDAVAAFFSQRTLPYLWPDIKDYKQYVDSQGDAQRRLRLSWIVAYLHHPYADVLLKTLRDCIPSDLLGTLAMTDALADLLVHKSPEVSSEAAKIIWKCSDASLKQIFTILSSQGSLPSGIKPSDARRAVEILRDCCPPSRRQLFGELSLSGFGPTLAGMEWDLKPRVISFKERIMKPGAFGSTCVYEVYVGSSKMDALKFLEDKEATQDNYFIVVETPDGNWGKDRMGIYKEPSQMEEIKETPEKRSDLLDVSITKKCAICGESVASDSIVCPRCGRGVFETEKRYSPQSTFRSSSPRSFGQSSDKPAENTGKKRDVCAKCGITREERLRWWRGLPETGETVVGGHRLVFQKVSYGDDENDARELFLYCNHCKKGICGGCSIDLGQTAGCPFCRNELVYMDGTSQ
jgi:hypothetical protein